MLKNKVIRTLRELMQDFPPFVVIALARHKEKGCDPVAITLNEISERSGIPIRSLGRIAAEMDWGRIHPDSIDTITTASGFNFFNTCKDRQYIQKMMSKKKDGRVFPHMSDKQHRIFNRRMERWLNLRWKEKTPTA